MADEVGKDHFWEGPDSLDRRLRMDKSALGATLRNKRYRAEMSYQGDTYSLERWAKQGFVSKGMSQDITEGDEREDSDA